MLQMLILGTCWRTEDAPPEFCYAKHQTAAGSPLRFERTEGRGRRTEGGGRRAEDGGQRMEDRRQETGDKGQRSVFTVRYTLASA
jgi:hypothetical protein